MDSRRVIVALDFPDAAAALAMAARLDPALCRVKVGKELFVSAGPAVVETLHARGFEVFLDLKFHDIPNTVAGAVRAAARLGVWMVNVHASGGSAMMRAAREAAAGFARPPLVIAVTVLTSLADADLAEIGLPGGAAANVSRLAGLAHASGLDGIVCSAAEAAMVRGALGHAFVTVTPGIRLPGDAKGDQSRVVTPQDAVRQGAHYLVIGRPVTQAADPSATLHAIARSLAGERTPS
ncbi:MAG TPA: orotidine-5'-phosphate decarboxylase [Usitatibacteraceae bacterium]|nr:orotidine-5'-phosphate decarboxylase [Burkholderiales bacterium]HQW38452.1 orotidine-5'-phosphate decarboxylase [Usitatibacteraceae bacterium]HQY48122.1 orotidine-5'-phosphate decarboxylase [Usitatibacteraceae bacterium]HRA23305.1 orotidine-5'-phosphate decarboxylase [Usitatibacteraceae bacterium]